MPTASARQCNGFQNIRAAADAAVDNDQRFLIHRVDDLGQDGAGTQALVELAAAMVRDIDAFDAELDAFYRVLRCGDPLDEERDVVFRLKTLETFPIERRLVIQLALLRRAQDFSNRFAMSRSRRL